MRAIITLEEGIREIENVIGVTKSEKDNIISIDTKPSNGAWRECYRYEIDEVLKIVVHNKGEKPYTWYEKKEEGRNEALEEALKRIVKASKNLIQKADAKVAIARMYIGHKKNKYYELVKKRRRLTLEFDYKVNSFKKKFINRVPTQEEIQDFITGIVKQYEDMFDDCLDDDCCVEFGAYIEGCKIDLIKVDLIDEAKELNEKVKQLELELEDAEEDLRGMTKEARNKASDNIELRKKVSDLQEQIDFVQSTNTQLINNIDQFKVTDYMFGFVSGAFTMLAWWLLSK